MRLVLAARLSRKGANGDDGMGIETQDKRGRDWAERQGHAIVHVAADTKSGTVPPWDRRNLKPWVTDPALMATYDGILAYKNDRLSRGCWSDEARIRQWAEEHRKVLVIVDGPQWPPRNDGDEWAWEAMAKMARKEWEAIRERSMRAQAELLERGKFVGRPPFGYVSVGEKYHHTIEPTGEGRRLIPEVFRRCIRGDSLADIAAWLAGPEQTGRPWWPRTVGTLIRNPTYMGRRCAQDPATKQYGKTLHRCEPLVDARTFRLAGKALDDRPKRGHIDPGRRAMLAGVLRCPRCADSPMYRLNTGYYRCAGRGAARKGCGNMVRAEAADATVNAIMAADFDTPVMRHTVIPGNGADLAARLDDIRFDMRQLATADLDDAEHDDRLAALRAERDRVKAAEVVPDRVELAATGEHYAELWERTPVPERGPWLARHGFTVTAAKDGVTVRQGGDAHFLPLIHPQVR
jgi:DNA invertase Pin-like site-specific DNA recombinase